MCNSYTFNIPTILVDNNETNTPCVDVTEARYPNASDCDYQLKFHCKNKTVKQPIKISGKTVASKLILKSGAIEARKDGKDIYILIGKGRSQLIYGRIDPKKQLIRDIRIFS